VRRGRLVVLGTLLVIGAAVSAFVLRGANPAPKTTAKPHGYRLMRPSELEYCLSDTPAPPLTAAERAKPVFCLGKDGRYYKLLRTTPSGLVVRRVALADTG
jgi:hypothetical protein